MKKILFIFGIILIASCSASKSGMSKKGVDLKSFSGTWQQRDQQKFEKWAPISPTESVGVAYDMSTGNAVLSETMRLFKADDAWIYEVKVGSTQASPVQFRLMPDKTTKLRFVNEKNDHPQVIKYFMGSDTTMKAEISDINGGNVVKFDFVKYVKK